MNVSQKTTATWTNKGCYVDASDRMLRGYSVASSSMTTERCLSICLERGFTMAGTQNGDECFCGNQLFASGGVGALAANQGDCATKCKGEFCLERDKSPL